MSAPLEKQIRATCQEMADFLVEKNRAYGNSAAEPVGIFSKRLDPLAQIDVRIDDKLNRLLKGNEYAGDDTIKDLAGYLLLRMIVAAEQKKESAFDLSEEAKKAQSARVQHGGIIPSSHDRIIGKASGDRTMFEPQQPERDPIGSDEEFIAATSEG